MKKVLLFFLLSCLAPALLPAQVKYRLSGRIGRLGAPAKMLFHYTTPEGGSVTDSTVLHDGKFAFTGTVSAPVRAFLTLYPQGVRTGRNTDGTSLYLEKGKVRVESVDSLTHAVVKGGKVNDDSRRLQELLAPSYARSRALMATYQVYTPEQKKDKAFMASVEKAFDEAADERRGIYRQFITDHPDSYVSLDIIRMAVGSVPAYQDIASVFACLSPSIRNSPGGKVFADKIEKLKAVGLGMEAPDFTQNDPNGVPVQLSSFRGKYVLIDFWASWCGPCRAENPNVVKAYARYKDRNFTVLGVSLDQPGARDRWMKAIADDHLDWTQVSDLQYWKNAAAQLYQVQAIPQNFLVDPSGKIVARNLRGEELDRKLAELMN